MNLLFISNALRLAAHTESCRFALTYAVAVARGGEEVEEVGGEDGGDSLQPTHGWLVAMRVYYLSVVVWWLCGSTS